MNWAVFAYVLGVGLGSLGIILVTVFLAIYADEVFGGGAGIIASIVAMIAILAVLAGVMA